MQPPITLGCAARVAAPHQLRHQTTTLPCWTLVLPARSPESPKYENQIPATVQPPLSPARTITRLSSPHLNTPPQHPASLPSPPPPFPRRPQAAGCRSTSPPAPAPPRASQPLPLLPRTHQTSCCSQPTASWTHPGLTHPTASLRPLPTDQGLTLRRELPGTLAQRACPRLSCRGACGAAVRAGGRDGRRVHGPATLFQHRRRGLQQRGRRRNRRRRRRRERDPARNRWGSCVVLADARGGASASFV